jgi:hypothetical protein
LPWVNHITVSADCVEVIRDGSKPSPKHANAFATCMTDGNHLLKFAARMPYF